MVEVIRICPLPVVVQKFESDFLRFHQVLKDMASAGDARQIWRKSATYTKEMSMVVQANFNAAGDPPQFFNPLIENPLFLKC